MTIYVSMELPSDILPLVREFSKPLFRFRNEYDEVVTMLNREWPELKAKLNGPQADLVGRCLQDYIAAYGECIRIEEDFEKHNADWACACVPNTDTVRTYAYWDKYGWFKDECQRLLVHEMVVFQELQDMVAM